MRRCTVWRRLSSSFSDTTVVVFVHSMLPPQNESEIAIGESVVVVVVILRLESFDVAADVGVTDEVIQSEPIQLELKVVVGSRTLGMLQRAATTTTNGEDERKQIARFEQQYDRRVLLFIPMTLPIRRMGRQTIMGAASAIESMVQLWVWFGICVPLPEPRAPSPKPRRVNRKPGFLDRHDLELVCSIAGLVTVGARTLVSTQVSWFQNRLEIGNRISALFHTTTWL